MTKKKKLDYLEITQNLLKAIARSDEEFQESLRNCIGLTEKQFEEYIDNVDSAQCATVNIIEILQGNLIGVTSFPDTQKGNELAEKKFRECILDRNDPDRTTDVEPLSDEDMEFHLENSNYNDDCGYELIITHSTP